MSGVIWRLRRSAAKKKPLATVLVADASALEGESPLPASTLLSNRVSPSFAVPREKKSQLSFVPPTSLQFSDNVEGLRNKLQYLKEVKDFLKLDFPADIASLIAEYFSGEEGVSELLNYVVKGEQAKAEVLVTLHPKLLLKKGTVRDLSRREFKDVTAFQYALWALDWHMWRMLLKYMDSKDAALQFAELEDTGTLHGKHFSLAPMIEALNTYVKHYDAWDGSKRQEHWCGVVGRSQLLLPVSIVNEYCHPRRSFVPVPKYEEETLKRSIEANVGSWYTAQYNGGKLGEKFGYCRYNWSQAEGRVGNEWLFTTITLLNPKSSVRGDIEALQCLSRVRETQLQALSKELSTAIQAVYKK